MIWNAKWKQILQISYISNSVSQKQVMVTKQEADSSVSN